MKDLITTIIKQERSILRLQSATQNTYPWGIIYVLLIQPTSDISSKIKYISYLSKHLFSLKREK